MALKIGTIEADIGADTSDLKRAEAEVVRSTKKMDSALQTTENAAAGVGKGFNKVQKSATSAVVKGFRPAKNAAQQMGFQMQDVIVQLQSGTSAFTVIAQQGSQMAGIFGPGGALFGAVIALAAALGGVLFRSFMDSSEAADRANESASDLTTSYLKLTGQTEALANVKLSKQMIVDAESALILGKRLRSLKDDQKSLQIAQDEFQKQFSQQQLADLPTSVTTFAGLTKLNKEVADTQNRFDTLSSSVAFAQSELNKAFNQSAEGLTADVPGQETNVPGGGGSTFNQIIGEEIAALELRGKLFNDSDATIEAEIMRFELAALNLFEEGSDEFLRAEQALADKRIELREKADDKILQSAKRSQEKLDRQQRTARQAALNGLVQLGDQLNNALEAAGKEGSAIGKAIFLANKAIQVVTILAATEVAAAQAAAVAAIGGSGAFFATAGVIRAAGFASAGLVAGLAVGESFQDGGVVGGSSFSGDRVMARVNSGEMILNSSQQSALFNMANGRGSGGGMPKITIINEPGVTTEVQSVSMSEVIMVARAESNKVANSINASLQTGRGKTADSLRQGFQTSRNIN